MNNLPQLKIRNIKVSVILEQDLDLDTSFSSISKYDNLILTVYPNKRNLVNVTKIQSIDQLMKLDKIISSKFNNQCKKVRIDSIMLSRKVKNRQFSLKKMLETCRQHQADFKLDFNVESFHAPWIKSNFGSFNLFISGSSTVMGCRKLSDIDKIQEFLAKVYCKENEIK